MDRRKFVRNVAVGGAAAATAATASAQADSLPTIRWRVQNSYPKSLGEIYDIQEDVMTAVGRMTAGKFTCQFFQANEIVPVAGMINAGITFFLLPMAAMTAWMTLPLLARTFVRAEHSPSEGGLLLRPAWAMVVVGFVLLILQAPAELVKRAAELRGIALEPPSGGGKEELDPLGALIQQRQGDDEQ